MVAAIDFLSDQALKNILFMDHSKKRYKVMLNKFRVK